MLVVPLEAMPHLVAATRQELSRQEAMRTQALAEDEWPNGYDCNDAPLFEMALHALAAAQSNGSEQVDLSGKALWFLTKLLPEYVGRNIGELSELEYEALRTVYRQKLTSCAGEFPAR
jgi:hypothetical protein